MPNAKPIETRTLPTGHFTADVHCDACGMRDRLQLARAVHAVDMGGRYVIPANGSCDCPDCDSMRQGGMTTFRRVD